MASSLTFPVQTEILKAASKRFGDSDPLFAVTIDFAEELVTLYISEDKWAEDFGTPEPVKGEEFHALVKVSVRQRGQWPDQTPINDLKVSYVSGSARTSSAL